ncbi:MAG: hypothetical protein HPY74_15780 [Firmicutes bacterium]|nr:hypothetical protein [Bacillota bacterium]
MKMKNIITGMVIIGCAALCAAVWPRSAGEGKVPIEPMKTAVNAEMEAGPEETQQILLSAVTPVPENETEETEITAEKETQKPPQSQAVQPVKPAPSSSEPHMGDVRVVDGEKQVYILGFGWLKDEGGENVGTVAEDMYENGNKIGVMGGGTMVGNPGDELTGNKVGIMGRGTTVDGKGDITKQVGIMSGAESEPNSSPSPPSEPEVAGDVIYTELQPPVTKNSTPPPYKPNGEPIAP